MTISESNLLFPCAKRCQIAFLIIFIVMSIPVYSQSRIPLPHETTHALPYPAAEQQYRSALWGSELISNISTPELLLFEPVQENKNGASVILAPGGGLYVLSIMGEGIQVAEWLTEKGFTVFILKYRLVPTQGDGAVAISEHLSQDAPEMYQNVEEVLPYAIQDGIQAVKTVRTLSDQYGLDPQRVALMGFSAGGAVSMGVLYEAEPEDRPDFFIPVYAWTSVYPVQDAPESAPPMLVICATNDGLDLAKGSVELYQSWVQKGFSAGLQMYAQGGHGFGMRKQGLPSDNWIERFYEWAVAEGMAGKAP